MEDYFEPELSSIDEEEEEEEHEVYKEPGLNEELYEEGGNLNGEDSNRLGCCDITDSDRSTDLELTINDSIQKLIKPGKLEVCSFECEAFDRYFVTNEEGSNQPGYCNDTGAASLIDFEINIDGCNKGKLVNTGNSGNPTDTSIDLELTDVINKLLQSTNNNTKTLYARHNSLNLELIDTADFNNNRNNSNNNNNKLTAISDKDDALCMLKENSNDLKLTNRNRITVNKNEQTQPITNNDEKLYRIEKTSEISVESSMVRQTTSLPTKFLELEENDFDEDFENLSLGDDDVFIDSENESESDEANIDKNVEKELYTVEEIPTAERLHENNGNNVPIARPVGDNPRYLQQQQQQKQQQYQQSQKITDPELPRKRKISAEILKRVKL